jgi:methylmalonic aciduria homocystinuria type C protein
MLEAFTARCLEAGFDLVQPFDLAAFNEGAAPEDRLPDHGRPHALAVVVGNSRALWPAFVAACRREPGSAAAPHPLNRYAVRVITAAAEVTGWPFAARWAHVLEPRPVPIQRVAEAAGLVRSAPCLFSIHPRLGLWVALRAVVVFDRDGVAASPLAHPCEGCPRPCLPALERARSSTDWRDWLAVRDACPIGRDARYPEAQIAYHYTRRGLQEALE